MKTLEINEKIAENQGVIHLIIALEYQIEYQSNAKT